MEQRNATCNSRIVSLRQTRFFNTVFLETNCEKLGGKYRKVPQNQLKRFATRTIANNSVDDVGKNSQEIEMVVRKKLIIYGRRLEAYFVSFSSLIFRVKNR